MKMKLMKMAICTLAVITVGGCESTYGGGGGASDTDMIQSVLDDMMAALQAQDVDKMVSFYSDDFTSDNGDKAATQEFLAGAKDQGFLEDLEIDISELQIAVDGDSATAEPITLEGAFGELTLGFELQKRGGSWIVTSQSQS